MAAVDATDCAIDGTVICASRAEGRTALAGLAATVAASGRGGMARAAAPASPAGAMAGSGTGLAADLARVAGELPAAASTARVFGWAGTEATFLGADGATFRAGLTLFGAGLTTAFLAGTAFTVGWVALATDFNGLGGTLVAGLLAAPVALPLAAVFAAVLDAGLLVLGASLV